MWKTLTLDQKRELVSSLQKDGLSAAQIAERIGGTTRNAIIGFTRRNLQHVYTKPAALSKPRTRAEKPKAEAEAPVPRRKESSKPLYSYKFNSSGKTTATAEADLNNPAWDALEGREAVPLYQLSPFECHWPIGRVKTIGYCGLPATHKRYCSTHHAMAWVPRVRRS